MESDSSTRRKMRHRRRRLAQTGLNDLDDFNAIDNAYGGVKMIIRGYDRRHEGLAMNQWTATVDAGCGFGGRLAAACFLPDGSATEWIEV